MFKIVQNFNLPENYHHHHHQYDLCSKLSFTQIMQ